MTLMNQIREDMKTAMRERDTERTGTLRMLLADVRRKEIDGGSELTDPQIISVIRSGVKSRTDSMEAYQSGNRPDLAEKEAREIAILETYLPAAMPEAELEALVRKAISQSGAESMRDMGKVMPLVMKEAGDRTDGKTVSEMVRRLLS